MMARVVLGGLALLLLTSSCSKSEDVKLALPRALTEYFNDKNAKYLFDKEEQTDTGSEFLRSCIFSQSALYLNGVVCDASVQDTNGNMKPCGYENRIYYIAGKSSSCASCGTRFTKLDGLKKKEEFSGKYSLSERKIIASVQILQTNGNYTATVIYLGVNCLKKTPDYLHTITKSDKSGKEVLTKNIYENSFIQNYEIIERTFTFNGSFVYPSGKEKILFTYSDSSID